MVSLLVALAFSQAHAAVEVSSFSASGSDNIAATHNEGIKGYEIRNTGISVNDVRNMQDAIKTHANELASLKRIIDEQARVIDELKRNNASSGSGSRTRDTDIASLKSQLDEQGRGIKQLEGQVSDLKRSNGNSSSSEISSLKRDISDQERELKSVRRDVDDLSRKVK
ncbi:hypothetical protein [Pseudomonas sp. NPDC089734]|uniref:hypothetical protein n=1 Tax=Pseudomonas sp. NPDC089734 TaxID=3364469 RepID=UPI0037F22514